MQFIAGFGFFCFVFNGTGVLRLKFEHMDWGQITSPGTPE